MNIISQVLSTAKEYADNKFKKIIIASQLSDIIDRGGLQGVESSVIEEIYQILSDDLNDSDDKVRTIATWALYNFVKGNYLSGNKVVGLYDIVLKLCNDRSDDTRTSAIAIISRLAEQNTIPSSKSSQTVSLLMEKATNDSHKGCQVWACIAIAYLSRKYPCDEEYIARCIDILLSYEDDNGWKYRVLEGLCAFVDSGNLPVRDSLVKSAILRAHAKGESLYVQMSLTKKTELAEMKYKAMAKLDKAPSLPSSPVSTKKTLETTETVSPQKPVASSPKTEPSPVRSVAASKPVTAPSSTVSTAVSTPATSPSSVYSTTNQSSNSQKSFSSAMKSTNESATAARKPPTGTPSSATAQSTANVASSQSSPSTSPRTITRVLSHPSKSASTYAAAYANAITSSNSNSIKAPTTSSVTFAPIYPSTPSEADIIPSTTATAASPLKPDPSLSYNYDSNRPISAGNNPHIADADYSWLKAKLLERGVCDVSGISTCVKAFRDQYITSPAVLCQFEGFTDNFLRDECNITTRGLRNRLLSVYQEYKEAHNNSLPPSAEVAKKLLNQVLVEFQSLKLQVSELSMQSRQRKFSAGSASSVGRYYSATGGGAGQYIPPSNSKASSTTTSRAPSQTENNIASNISSSTVDDVSMHLKRVEQLLITLHVYLDKKEGGETFMP